MTALEFSEVRFRYAADSPLLLDGLSFRVEAGEFVSILGPSGAGKSSLFRLMNGLLAPESGKILVGGAAVSAEQSRCGYMPQQDLLFPWRTVAENVELPLELGRQSHSAAERKERVAEVLSAVGLGDWAEKSPLALSGGMRQRAAFARTLLTGAEGEAHHTFCDPRCRRGRLSLGAHSGDCRAAGAVLARISRAAFLSAERGESRRVGGTGIKAGVDSAFVAGDGGMREEKFAGRLPSLLTMAGFFLLWEVLARRMNAAYILPAPTQIVKRIYELRAPLFLVHLPATMAVVALSLTISAALGIFLAVLMDQSRTAERALYPLLVASQTIPTTALAPLFVLWLGYGIWSKVLAAVLMTFFPIAVTLSDGFRAIPPEMTELMQTLGATRWQLFRKLKLPAVLPYFFTAIRMAIPLSVIGAAIGEWLGAQAGLGYFSRRMMTQLDGAGVFAPIVLLSLAAMLLTEFAKRIEQRALRFRNQRQTEQDSKQRRKDR